MREFNVIRKDGTGMVIDAISEDEVLSTYPGVISVEETKESLERNENRCIINCDEEEAYYEDIYAKLCEEEELTPKEVTLRERVNKTIILVNKSLQVSAWEKKFVFGLKRQVNNHSRITDAQIERLNTIYSRLA